MSLTSSHPYTIGQIQPNIWLNNSILLFFHQRDSKSILSHGFDLGIL
jgi:hypothetical protein